MTLGCLLLAVTASGCECAPAHEPSDGGPPDGAPWDASPDTGAVDAAADDDAGGGAGCAFDPSGTWQLTFVRAPDQCGPGEDGPVELTMGGYMANFEDVCSRAGCTPENCEVLPAVAPDCVARVHVWSPCDNTSRDQGWDFVHRVVSPTRIEGAWILTSADGECEQRYELTR